MLSLCQRNSHLNESFYEIHCTLSVCQQLSQRQDITVGYFPARPVQSGAEQQVRANLLSFRSLVQTETLHAGCHNSKKKGQSLPTPLALELPWWRSVSLWASIWRFPFTVLQSGFGSCFEFIYLEQMHSLVSWHPGVSIALCTGFCSILSQIFCSDSGLLLAPLQTSLWAERGSSQGIFSQWNWLFRLLTEDATNYIVWKPRATGTSWIRTHAFMCTTAWEARHYLFCLLGWNSLLWCSRCTEVRPMGSAHQMGNPGNVTEPVSDADE